MDNKLNLGRLRSHKKAVDEKMKKDVCEINKSIIAPSDVPEPSGRGEFKENGILCDLEKQDGANESDIAIKLKTGNILGTLRLKTRLRSEEKKLTTQSSKNTIRSIPRIKKEDGLDTAPGKSAFKPENSDSIIPPQDNPSLNLRRGRSSASSKSDPHEFFENTTQPISIVKKDGRFDTTPRTYSKPENGDNIIPPQDSPSLNLRRRRSSALSKSIVEPHEFFKTVVKKLRLEGNPTYNIKSYSTSKDSTPKICKFKDNKNELDDVLLTPKARTQLSLYDSPNFILRTPPMTPALKLKSRTPTLCDYVCNKKKDKFKVLDMTPSTKMNSPASGGFILEQFFTKKSKVPGLKKNKFNDFHGSPFSKRVDSVNNTAHTTKIDRKTQNDIANVTTAAVGMYTGEIPNEFIGREYEKELLNNFWRDYILKEIGTSLCITGCPGSGKTALLNNFLKLKTDEIEKKKILSLKIIKLNCVSIVDSTKLFSIILSHTTSRRYQSKSLERTALKSILIPFTNSQKRKLPMYIIVLDEIDYIVHKNNEDIYRLFEWAAAQNSRLILIGISNTLNFIDDHISLLNSLNIAPKKIIFKPYTVPEIKEIVEKRLYNAQNIIPSKAYPAAIELIARKAAGTGDLRKALALFRNAICLSLSGNDGSVQLSLENALAVSKKLCYQNKESLILSLTLQQKTVLFALLKQKKKTVSLIDLFTTYKFLFSETTEGLAQTTRSEFSDIIAYLESAGFIILTSKYNQLSSNLSKDWLSTNVIPAFNFKYILSDLPEILK